MAVFNIPDIYGRFTWLISITSKQSPCLTVKNVAIYSLNLMIAPEWQYRQDLIVKVRKKLTEIFVALSVQDGLVKREVI